MRSFVVTAFIVVMFVYLEAVISTSDDIWFVMETGTNDLGKSLGARAWSSVRVRCT